MCAAGGALAVLAAMSLCCSILDKGHDLKHFIIKLITFGQPRVGNTHTASVIDYMLPDVSRPPLPMSAAYMLQLQYWRMVNEGDPVI